MTGFLANENFPLVSVKRLRNAGHDVAAITEDSPGITDAAVLARAARESRIILTFDRDYGELIYRLKYTAPAGVVYFRFDPQTPEERAEYLLRILALSDISLSQKFTVAERDRLRQRPLP